jgi:tellurite resistance protein
MDKGIFSDREKAMEANYFREQDARLLEKLRRGAKLDEIAEALRDKLNVDNPELLERARAVGVTAETAPAFFLAPLVQVAWAEGKVSNRERSAVLRLATQREVDEGSPAYAQLERWLDTRPSDELFDTAAEVLTFGFAVLPFDEREERIKRVVDACREVAAASGSELAHQLGLGTGVSRTEAQMLDEINSRLRKRG